MALTYPPSELRRSSLILADGRAVLGSPVARQSPARPSSFPGWRGDGSDDPASGATEPPARRRPGFRQGQTKELSVAAKPPSTTQMMSMDCDRANSSRSERGRDGTRIAFWAVGRNRE
jgi:hypothetical protein